MHTPVHRAETYKSIVQEAKMLTVVCAWCGKVKKGGVWFYSDVDSNPNDLSCTHGICPSCAHRAFQDAALEIPGLLDGPE